MSETCQLAEPFDGPVWDERKRKFRHPESFTSWNGLPTWCDLVKWLLTEKDYSKIPKKSVLNQTLPILQPQFPKNSSLAATWLGHATVLVQMDKANFLTDPVWAERASPLKFVGCPRYRKPPCSIEDLPTVHFALISHNHYDHCDVGSIKKLSKRFPELHWFVPSRLAKWMRSIVPNAPVTELTWGQKSTLTIGGRDYEIICTPAQHCSQRRFNDRFKTLWCGWAVRAPTSNFFFAGDTGLCEDEFRKVGKNFGPFDLAALPIGAYAPRWAMKSQHAHPCDTVRMHQLIGARATIGIHWGSVERLCLSPSHLLYGCSTYYMGTNEAYNEPPLLLREEAEKANLGVKECFTLMHGGTWTKESGIIEASGSTTAPSV